jgi:hypothetical protein
MMGMLAEESGGDLSMLRSEITQMVADMQITPRAPDDSQPEPEVDNPE